MATGSPWRPGAHALLEMQARVAAIAGIYRRLYTSQDVRPGGDMGTCLESLVRELEAAMEARPMVIACGGSAS